MATDIQNWQNTFRNTTPVNRGIWGSAMNRNMFTPQALNAFRSVAASPLGVGARAIFGIPGAVAATPFLAASGIDALTKRDPDATRSSLFNIDLTRNANEGAALPESNLADWGSEMGPIPDGGVVPPTKKINTPLPSPYQDRIMNENLMRDRGNIDNKGFSFNPLNWGLMGLARKMIEPNTPEENFGRGYFNMDSSGRTYGNQAHDVFAGKNVVSAFGQGMGAAGQKRMDTIENTLRTKYGLNDAQIADIYAGTFNEEEADINTPLVNRLQTFNKQLAHYRKNLKASTSGADTTGSGYITKKTTTGGTTGGTGDGSSKPSTSYSTGAAQGTKGSWTPGGTYQGGGYQSKQGSHHYKEGGRIGYATQGFVDPEEPDENVFEIMQDQGIPYSEMAQGGEGIIGQLIAKYIEAGFPPDQAEAMAMQEFEQMAAGQEDSFSEEGIASIV